MPQGTIRACPNISLENYLQIGMGVFGIGVNTPSLMQGAKWLNKTEFATKFKAGARRLGADEMLQAAGSFGRVVPDPLPIPRRASRWNPPRPNRGQTIPIGGTFMGQFDEIKSRIDGLSSLDRVSSESVAALISQCSGLPKDYLAFLHEVGYGNLGEI